MLGASFVTILLAVAALVVYVKAVRYDKAWGTPLMTILVLGAVAAVIIPRTPQWRRAQLRRHREPPYLAVQMIGEELSDQLSEGARAIIIREQTGAEMMEMERAMYEEDEDRPEHFDEMPTAEEEVAEVNEKISEAFQKGAGFDINIVASLAGRDMAHPGENPTETLNELIAPYENENIDIVISLIGLPGNPYEGIFELEELVSFDWTPKPMFAAEVGMDYFPDIIREYIQDGLMEAAVILSGGERVVISADNLDELPEEDPMDVR